MGRPLREISPTGIYHVMLRGVNKQRIFEETEDYNIFIRILIKSITTDKLGKLVEEPNFDLYAYCLMDNHVHMLIGTRVISISDIVKRIASTYARVFNQKYDRVGHFFQDRFRSEIVGDEDYFYHLLSYIHRNPIEAGICSYPDEYPFSSYRELTDTTLGGCRSLHSLSKLHKITPLVSDTNYTKLCNLSNIQSRIGSITPDTVYASLEQLNSDLRQIDEAYEKGIPFPEDNAYFPSPQDDLAHYPEILLAQLSKAVHDKAPKATIDELIVCSLLFLTDTANISDFQRLEKKTMRVALAQIRGAGVSIRRLSHLSGISEGIIRNCKTPLYDSFV